MAVIVGTSGYDYQEWVGEDRFYPASLAQRRPDWLTYYASQFPLVELNFTYYGTTSPRQLENMLKRIEPRRRLSLLEGEFAPRPDFSFVIKAYASLTHEIGRDWREQAARFVTDTAPLQEAGRLTGVLAQFPSRFRRTQQTLTYVARLVEALSGLRVIAEFRDMSWFREDMLQLLREHGLVVAGVDAPEEAKLPRSLEEPAKAAQAGPEFQYFRLHGRREGSWWSGDAASRYEYRYSNGQLQQFALRLVTSMQPRTCVVFNNHRYADAAKNARQIEHLLQALFRIKEEENQDPAR
jgi:uncharacterized protein YecE (DUF72 family)